MEAQNLNEAILGYYKKNKKRLLQEAIEKDNVQLSNSLIKLYTEMGESLDEVFADVEVVERITEKVSKENEPNLSEIFARKLR